MRWTASSPTAAGSSQPEQAAAAVTEAFEFFAAGRPRPVHIEVPLDVLEQPWTGTAAIAVPARPAVPTAAAIESAAEALAAASAPMIIAGGGARGASYRDPLTGRTSRCAGGDHLQRQGRPAGGSSAQRRHQSFASRRCKTISPAATSRWSSAANSAIPISGAALSPAGR